MVIAAVEPEDRKMVVGPMAEMPSSSAGSESSPRVALSQQIARSLKRRYPWVELDDLEGYAFLGLAMAAKDYRADMGVPFRCYAGRKGMYLAVDEMRRARVLRHASAAKRPRFLGLNALDRQGGPIGALEAASTDSDRDMARLEAKDTLTFLMGQLRPRDRRLLLLRYADDLNFREMGLTLGLSESGVCLRHKCLLAKLRNLAGVGPQAGLGEGVA
jgi:RNA polymerase sigma factor (sigma-70 family)